VAGDIRTLLVEDNPDFRLLIAARLNLSSDFIVVGTATNGRDGIALAAEVQPDLVVLDVLMPVMGGPTALPGLRAVVPDAVVIYCTVLDRWLIEGIDPNRPPADGVISKERFIVRPTEVLAEIRDLVEGSRR
jgi:two-component system, NarL family, nitrate/nitrite response regulator NarL